MSTSSLSGCTIGIDPPDGSPRVILELTSAELAEFEARFPDKTPQQLFPEQAWPIVGPRIMAEREEAERQAEHEAARRTMEAACSLRSLVAAWRNLQEAQRAHREAVHEARLAIRATEHDDFPSLPVVIDGHIVDREFGEAGKEPISVTPCTIL